MIDLAEEALDRDSCPDPETVIVGDSLAIRSAIAVARRFARSHLPILLTGETGTGKELFAQEIHRWSGRSGPLVDVNCAALPRDLVEGELFGNRRGAFTGAADRPGLIAAAHGGTLFLDELSSLPVEGQAKLLRALETREVRRLGDSAKRSIDFRLVGAVQHGLEQAVRDGSFRLDLFQRIAGVVIRLPSLRDRMEDVLPLAERFAALRAHRLSPSLKEILARHSWPGNVRELRMAIDRAVILERTGCDVVTPAALVQAIDLGSSEREVRRPLDLGSARMAEAREQMLQAAQLADGDRHRLALDLGISMATLYRRLQHLELPLSVLKRREDPNR